MFSTSLSSSGYLPKNSLRIYAPSMARNAWYSPSTHSCMRLMQQPAGIARQQIVPARAPDHFDYVPAGAEKRRFQFLNDAAVAAHRPIQPLQIAVHHEDQVVELLARSQRQRAQRFRLIRFAVAQKRPNFALGLGNDRRDSPDSA